MAKKATTTPSKTKPTAKESSVKTPVKKAAAIDEQVALPGEQLEQLRKMNLWLALAFGVQMAAILLFGGAKSVPVTAQYLGVDQLASDMAGHQVLAAATHHLFDMRLSIVAAKPLFVLGLTCLLIATVGRSYYETQLRRGSNLARWLAFGLGGGMMVMALAEVSGVTDITVLALMLVLTILGFSLEPLAEKFKRQGKGGALPHALCAASVTGVVLPWAVLAVGIIGALLWDGHIPVSTYIMYATTALFFGCWALASHFRVRNQGKWADALYAEKMYMFLTLAAGSILAWQLFAGAI